MSGPDSRTFTAVVERDVRGRVTIVLPFDPSEAWGPKTRHHITGTIGGRRIRTTLPGDGPDARAVMGHACAAFDIGERVEVILEPEGPQLDSLAPDLADALAAPTRGTRLLPLPCDLLPEGISALGGRHEEEAGRPSRPDSGAGGVAGRRPQGAPEDGLTCAVIEVRVRSADQGAGRPRHARGRVRTENR